MTSTAHARDVLQDCRVALALLESETRDSEWRVHWVAAVTLLRSVGHVLAKVDGGVNPNVRAAADSLFMEWKGTAPEHEIFREFIEDERNNILKQYSFAVSEGPVELGIVFGEVDGSVTTEPVTILENIYRPMSHGFYEGEDGRTLIEMAIDWWEQQLAAIEEAVA